MLCKVVTVPLLRVLHVTSNNDCSSLTVVAAGSFGVLYMVAAINVVLSRVVCLIGLSLLLKQMCNYRQLSHLMTAYYLCLYYGVGVL